MKKIVLCVMLILLSATLCKSGTTAKGDFTYAGLTTRLHKFFNEYCRTYEQKDIDKFITFFASDAVEKGKPFKSWIPKYRQNFSKIDSIEYNIKLIRYATQEETGLVKIEGIFYARTKLLGSKKWQKNSGQIFMVLETADNSFKVKQLDYK